ncbi:MAG: MGMT family protein [Pseudomonadales bacterium]|nr:MGMT family protein [Pseudomonadales bacterium]
MDNHTSTLRLLIVQTVASIPAGKVASYGTIARLCGYATYARYVGTVLKQLPADTRLPWHRVINSKGEIAFPAGS